MAFPEGRKDWAKIIRFIMALIGLIKDIFFGDDDDGKK